jgi:hypothetical protein
VSEQAERLTIGEVERRSGVKATTLRCYETLGVLPEPARVSGQRRYTVDARAGWPLSTSRSASGARSRT